MREAQRIEFEAVFRSSYRSVFRTTYLILQDRARAEDVTQDAFLRLCERWQGVSRVEHPQAWVRQVATRAAIRHARWSRLRFSSAPPAETLVSDHLPDLDLARAVAALPPQQRAAVALFYLEDLPVDQVARLMGISTSSVKQHLHRARARLATELSELSELSELGEGVTNDVDR